MNEVNQSLAVLNQKHAGKLGGLGIKCCRRTASDPAMMGCDQTVGKSAGTGFPVEESFFDSFLILKR
jgi:hypothetical protein